MDYNHVAVFVQVVRMGGFSAAARALGLPKSSVSRTVALLEQSIKVRLLQRTTRTVSLTDAGLAFYEAVKTPVSAIDDADRLVREHGAAPQGVVRLAVAPEFGELPQVLTQFTRKYPGVQIEVSVASRFVDLIGEGFDMAIRAGKLDDSTLVAKRIGTTDLGLMAAPSYLRRKGRPKSFATLTDYDWVLYRSSGRRAQVQTTTANGRGQVQMTGPDGPRVIEVTATVWSDDLSFCRQAVIAGAGIGLLLPYTVSEELARGELVRLLPQWSTESASLYVVLPSNRFVPTRVALLQSFLIEHLGRQLLRAVT